MTKVVINQRHGGFSLSNEGEARLRELGWDGRSGRDVERDDPRLVQVVTELGHEAWGRFAELAVVEVPGDVEWHIHEYDGLESVHEDHRTWYSSGVDENC